MLGNWRKNIFQTYDHQLKFILTFKITLKNQLNYDGRKTYLKKVKI